MSNKYQDDTLKIFSLNGNRPLAEKNRESVRNRIR